MPADSYTAPAEGVRIELDGESRLVVLDQPIVCWLEGDGIGPDIWVAARHVFDSAVANAYGGARAIAWMELFAGGKAQAEVGEWLPQSTLDAISRYRVAIKGPMTTPVGGGMRSLNVALRQRLDLYACIRPVKYYRGTPSPMREPEKLDVVIVRENTEDVYAGIEWEAGSEKANRVIEFMRTELDVQIRSGSGIGIKPMSADGSKRLVRKAIRYALDSGRASVTLMHKGNIMKFTEGAFCSWGYEVAGEEFGNVTLTETELWDDHGGQIPDGKVVIKDRIADAMLQQVLLRPSEYDVIATPNLNGDYISDAAAAQVGGLGMAPGANMSDNVALFEPTHGTAPKYTGQDKVNPSSLILSGVMMLDHLGWHEAARLTERALEKTLQAKTVTYDLERQMDGATLLSCSEFGRALVDNMEN